jgi:hypothetical protein
MQRKGRVEFALDASLKKSGTVAAEDAAAVALSREYARAIDTDPEMLTKVGARLLEALVQLGMTPQSRAAVLKGQPPSATASKLDELRAHRDRKARPTA